MKSRTIKGLCIEPNPDLHPQIEFHLRTNGLEDVHALQGVVAGDDAGPEADFFLNPSNIASSLTGEFNPLVPVGGRVQKIRVPVVNLAREWERHFGDARVEALQDRHRRGRDRILEGPFGVLEAGGCDLDRVAFLGHDVRGSIEHPGLIGFPGRVRRPCRQERRHRLVPQGNRVQRSNPRILIDASSGFPVECGLRRDRLRRSAAHPARQADCRKGALDPRP